MPRTVGKYDLLDVIGIGGMGTVYRAFDRMLERVVALKIVRMEPHLAPADLPARFRNEARAVAQLHHPAIVTIFDYDDRDAAGPYIAMEYVDGCALNQYLKLRPGLHLEDVMSAMQQMLEGIVYAHRRGVVHRDIKPSNILVTRDGEIKITDFGIARFGTPSQTQSGTIMGTPQYMAPEQFRGAGVDHRCDVYAAGAVLYTLLAGAPPFNGTPVEVMYKVCGEAPKPLTGVDPAIPRAFQSVVSKALEKRPADRFASAAEFRDVLLSCWVGVSSNVVTSKFSEAGRRIVIAAAPSTSGPPAPATSQIAAHTPQIASQSVASWSREHLAEIERQLMSIMGPMARILVRDAAATTASKQELYQLLAGQLKSPEERRRFLQLGGDLPATPAIPATTMPAGLPGRPLTPEATQRASRLLARYLGPIATVVTRKLAQMATDEAHLYVLLAERVTNAQERERFIKEAARPG